MQTADMRDEIAKIGSPVNDICQVHTTLARRKKSHNALDLPEYFVRLFTEFEIKPAKLSIITPDD
jgi:hypothetical protein